MYPQRTRVASEEFLNFPSGGDSRQEFTTDLTYSTAEVTVSGDWAFERGTFCQTLTSRASGDVTQEIGAYLRVYFHDGNGSWKIARIIWNMHGQADAEEP